MKATKIAELNGGIVAKLGTRNVFMFSVNDEQFAVWGLPPWDTPEAVSKDEVEWEDV